jgi:predicted O-methyltransferase YrrM
LLVADYAYTEDWFSHVEPVWGEILYRFPPTRLLEIGSYEGRSACFLIERLAVNRPIELHCVDTWEGGIEHDRGAMSSVEARFDSNIAIARQRVRCSVNFFKHKARSSDALARLLANGARERFDLIYVDGSHQAPDVLTDAVLAFQLLKVGGVLIFDDYVWSMEDDDFYQMPKPAIDAFVNIHRRKLKLLQKPLYQLYLEKTAS